MVTTDCCNIVKICRCARGPLPYLRSSSTVLEAAELTTPTVCRQSGIMSKMRLPAVPGGIQPDSTRSRSQTTPGGTKVVRTPATPLTLHHDRFLPVAEPDLSTLEESMVMAAVQSGWVSSLGEYIGRFEAEFAEFCGTRYAVSTCNGTAALHLALAAGGVGPGDEVIVPALTFVATAAAVKHAGATPVFVECEPEIGTMHPAAIEGAVSSQTKAIIPVHLFGHPADMDPIIAIADKHGLLVIEDAAEAHGATYKGRVTGSLGKAGCFSFYGNKIMTTGEGGMITSDDESYVKHLRLLRDHAMDSKRRYWHPEVGFNYRLTNPQAAMGVAQLARFSEISEKRRRLLSNYRAVVADMKLPLVLNPSREWAVPTPWLVCAILDESIDPSRREHVLAELKSSGIDTRNYFIPLHLLPPYQECRTVGLNGAGLPETESLASRGFNLPSSGGLSKDDVRRVGKALEAAFASS